MFLSSSVKPKKYLWFCSFLKQIFHLRVYSTHCGILLFQVSPFLRENMDVEFFHWKWPKFVWKNLSLKTRSFRITVEKEIIHSSKGENDWESMDPPLKCTTSDTSGPQKFRHSKGSWGHPYPQPLHALKGITGSDTLGGRACASVTCLSEELEPLSPAGRTHLP